MKIPGALLEKINSHARQAYPEECCGILLGRIQDSQKVVMDVVEFENAQQDNKERRYLITAEEYVHAEKVAQARGLEVLGFYHSHPDHPARPSQYDQENAWTWFSYLITRVEKGEPAESTCWVLREDRSAFDEEKLITADESR